MKKSFVFFMIVVLLSVITASAAAQEGEDWLCLICGTENTAHICGECGHGGSHERGSGEEEGLDLLDFSNYGGDGDITAHVDLLVFRHRLPKAPRTFKVPFGPVLPLIGIAGTVYMIVNISTDPVERAQILGVTGIILLILFVYSLFWIHYKMKIPAFKPVPMEKVLAMENSMYYKIRKERGIWK